MKDLKDWAAVQRVYKETRSIRSTARILGIARNTVRSLLEKDQAPTYQRTVYASKIDIYKDQILEWRCEPYLFNGTRIFRELKKIGYSGSIGPVYYYLRKLDEDDGLISSKATTRHESPPGDQAQFDWSEYQMLIDNRYQTVYCFSMVLATSRKKAICFSLRQDADAIYEAVQELFDDLGGVTMELLIDNPKAFVISNNPKSELEIEYNPHALLMAKHLGTELNACPCYWPRKKGKVERLFNYIEEQFVKGNRFASMEDLNRRGKLFVDEWCSEVHSTTRRIPNQHYLLEERHTLLPLPKEHFYASRLQTRIISPDSYINVKSCKYSVPVRYVGKKVCFRINYGFRIMIYDSDGRFIQSREVMPEKHQIRTDAEHYEPVAPKVATSIPQIRRDFTSRFRNGARYLEAAGHRFTQPTHHARKILELQNLYDDDVLDAFIGIAIEENKMDIVSFRKIVREYNSGKRALVKDAVEKPQDNGASLERSCSYYEELTKEVSNAGNGG